jgi:hypothetical protein
VKQYALDHKAQLLNGPTASGMEIAVLVNFGSHPEAENKTLVWWRHDEK